MAFGVEVIVKGGVDLDELLQRFPFSGFSIQQDDHLKVAICAWLRKRV